MPHGYFPHIPNQIYLFLPKMIYIFFLYIQKLFLNHCNELLKLYYNIYNHMLNMIIYQYQQSDFLIFVVLIRIHKNYI